MERICYRERPPMVYQISHVITSACDLLRNLGTAPHSFQNGARNPSVASHACKGVNAACLNQPSYRSASSWSARTALPLNDEPCISARVVGDSSARPRIVVAVVGVRQLE